MFYCSVCVCVCNGIKNVTKLDYLIKKEKKKMIYDNRFTPNGQKKKKKIGAIKKVPSSYKIVIIIIMFFDFKSFSCLTRNIVWR